MSENILDIGKWKEMYPFFNNVLTMYDEFDSHVDGDINERHYDVMCDHIVKISNGDLKKHKNVCMKLMRNLGHRSGNSKFLYPTHDRCNVLYNWIYNSINKHSIPRNVIIKCYDDYTELKNVMDNKYICPYYSFDDIYEEPINIIMLKIFESNVNILISKLNDESNSFISSCQNYVCELVKIYNIMNSRYCPNVGENDIKRKNTCEILKTFKRTYMFYLFDKLIKKEVIPSLHDVENEYKNKCIPSKPKVPSNAPRYDNAHELQSSTGDIGEKKNDLSFQPPLNSENTGSSISSTVSTAVGTMAGASSILALLYKFTPGRNWMRSGIRGSRGRISSTLHAEQPNELFYDGFEGEVMSSYNPTYNVGYGSA